MVSDIWNTAERAGDATWKGKGIIPNGPDFHPWETREQENQEAMMHFSSPLRDDGEAPWESLLGDPLCIVAHNCTWLSTYPYLTFPVAYSCCPEFTLPNKVSSRPLSLPALFSGEAKLRRVFNLKLHLSLTKRLK